MHLLFRQNIRRWAHRCLLFLANPSLGTQSWLRHTSDHCMLLQTCWWVPAIDTPECLARAPHQDRSGFFFAAVNQLIYTLFIPPFIVVAFFFTQLVAPWKAKDDFFFHVKSMHSLVRPINNKKGYTCTITVLCRVSHAPDFLLNLDFTSNILLRFLCAFFLLPAVRVKHSNFLWFKLWTDRLE